MVRLCAPILLIAEVYSELNTPFYLVSVGGVTRNEESFLSYLRLGVRSENATIR
ncbi:MAG: hypothetical protein BMS9Abin02_0941 [Anaerolineae bacterium]|nr:MAG: hypothetical protein BMS9Abin02_0941 [Anaerolineae bacterium]